MALVARIKQLVYPITSRHLCTATHASGVLRGTTQRFDCLLVDNSMFVHYMIRKMFEGPVEIKSRRKIWIPHLRTILGRRRPGLDLCIAVLPARFDAQFEGLHFARTREFVLQVVDTSRPWDEIAAGFHANKRSEVSQRRRSEHGFAHRVSRDPADLELFYRRMYLPHLEKFSASAHPSSFESMTKRLASGFLVFITEGDEAVAGALCSLEGEGQLFYRWAGVLDGDERHVKSGAQMATYYVLLTIAKERGYRVLDLQKSRPLLDDGVYKTKRAWGATVLADAESESTGVYFFNPAGSPSVAHFLEANPIIVHTPAGLRGLVGQPALDDSVPPSCAAELSRRYRSPGLAGLTVMTGTGRQLQVS